MFLSPFLELFFPVSFVPPEKTITSIQVKDLTINSIEKKQTPWPLVRK
jgi:hypothetical protein